MQQRAGASAALTVALIGGVFSAGCSFEVDGSEKAVPPDGQGLIAGAVDAFDDGNVTDWQDFADATSTVSHRLSSTRAQNGSTSMKVTYAIAAGGYGGVEKRFSSRVDWSGAGSLSMWVYGLGTGHPFTVQIYDGNNERWETTFKVDFTGWKQQLLPFASFAQSGFQSPSAIVDGVRDFGNAQAIALVVAGGGQSGSVYIDAMVTTTTTTSSGAGAPATPPSAPSAPTTPPAASTPTGMIIPLYLYPDSTSSNWDPLFTAHAANPTVPIVAIVSAGLSDPAGDADANYQRAVARLLAAGIRVAGYVPTTYAARPLADVKANIDRWLTYYPGVDAIFFDEQGYKAGQEDYYRELAAYANSKGITMTIGNPGTDIPESFMGVLDITLIYESLGLPTAARIGGWHANYDRKHFGIIPYGCGEADLAFVPTAKKTVGWIYIQSDVLPNPWDSLPPYLGALVAALK
jgi:hypothetical protein